MRQSRPIGLLKIPRQIPFNKPWKSFSDPPALPSLLLLLLRLLLHFSNCYQHCNPTKSTSLTAPSGANAISSRWIPRLFPHTPPPVRFVPFVSVFSEMFYVLTNYVHKQLFKLLRVTSEKFLQQTFSTGTPSAVFSDDAVLSCGSLKGAEERSPTSFRALLKQLLLPRLKLQSAAARAFSTPESFPAHEFDSRDYSLLLFNKILSAIVCTSCVDLSNLLKYTN